MTVLVVANNLFNQMQSYETLKCNQKERQQMKYSFIDRIKEKVPLRWNRAKKLAQVIDEIIFKATDRGYSFNGRETLAKKCNASLATVDKAIRVLKKSNEVIVAYRHNPGSNGYKTPIIILKRHEYFRYWKELLNIEESVEEKVAIPQTPDAPRGEKAKTDSYLSNTKKQESNIYINNHNKIVQFVVNRVQDSVKQGAKITFLSSYIDKVVRSLEQQAIFAENLRLNKLKKQREQEFSQLVDELGFKQAQKPIPFYDWLNE